MDIFLALVGMFISVVLIGIILLQRGRGGGLVGALSGLGGQSAFGTKAGDTFTRITIGIAAAWVILAGLHGCVLRARTEKSGSLPDRIEIPSKSQETGVSSTKSEDSKAETGSSKSITDGADEVGRDEDAKKKPKSETSATEDNASKTDDAKKSTNDSKSAPNDETKSDGETK
jgi:preprotein translocase subunit SecG